MRKKWFLGLFLLFILSACNPSKSVEEKNIVIGFSQSGTESQWRKRHTASIREELKKNHYEVLYRNGYMNQERQIQDIRTFIAYKVDLIVFTPLQEDGWEPVLKEAKEADIPVIIVDRQINVSDPELYVTHIGPSFKAEGQRAGLYISNHFAESKQPTINVLELAGLADTSPTILRTDGFSDAIGRDARIKVTATLQGDYIRMKGKEQMAAFIKNQDLSAIDVLYSHNDEMTLGALEAIQETDIVPGKDLIIVTIDAQEEMIKKLRMGIVNCVVECNPDAGWYVASTIDRYFSGKELPKEIYMFETVFSETNLDKIPPRNY